LGPNSSATLLETSTTSRPVLRANGGSTVALDGVDVDSAQFTALARTDWETATIPASDGFRTVTGNQPFGLTSYGTEFQVSYAYPAGLNGSAGE
jgi:hypothetical protein